VNTQHVFKHLKKEERKLGVAGPSASVASSITSAHSAASHVGMLPRAGSRGRSSTADGQGKGGTQDSGLTSRVFSHFKNRK